MNNALIAFEIADRRCFAYEWLLAMMTPRLWWLQKFLLERWTELNWLLDTSRQEQLQQQTPTMTSSLAQQAGFGLYLVQEKRGKFFFESDNISDFQTFRLSVKICGKHNSKTITFFDLRPGEEKLCSDRNLVPRCRCRPPPMPPLPPSPQKRVFPPIFKFEYLRRFRICWYSTGR